MEATIDDMNAATPALVTGFIAFCEACGEAIGRFQGPYGDRPRLCLPCGRGTVQVRRTPATDD